MSHQSQPPVPSRTVGEPAATYVVDSWDGLSHLPVAHLPGTFALTYFPDPGAPPDTGAAFRQAMAASLGQGRPRFRELLASEGGVVTAAQMGELLGISRQAVDKRRKAGKLLAVEEAGRGYLYPVWQVRDGRPLPGLERVLATLRAGEFSGKSQVIFFLSPRTRFYDMRALDLLRAGTARDIEEVDNAAVGYLEQGSI